MTTELTGLLHGSAADDLGAIIERFEGYLANDPDYSFQAAAFRDGEPILDVWGGPHFDADSIVVPWSVTKGIIGFSVGLLIERGMLDLDERVAHYWPEFAAQGKEAVTVRQLLSHQAGLPATQPPLTMQEQLHQHDGGTRLANTRPYWQPGTAFGYHAVTIGNLAMELIFRVTGGTTLHEFYESEIRRPHEIDFYLGLPPQLDDRLVHHLPMIVPVDPSGPGYYSPLQRLVFSRTAGSDFSRDEASYRFGHPAGSGVGSARGIAALYAAGTTGLRGAPAFLSRDTVEIVAQQQVRGYDEVLGQPHRAHGIVFQKPTPSMAVGGERAFGHDGAFGGLGWADPDTGVTFGYVVARAPWPGGADPRALALAAQLLG